MGRCDIRLDPTGYKYLSEPGFTYFVTGRKYAQIISKELGSGAEIALNRNLLWNPPGSEWLVAKPLQFDPEWEKDTTLGGGLANYVIPKSKWTFASGISAYEFQPSRKADGTTYPDNQWIGFAAPSSITGLDNCSYSNLFTACGLTAPPGIGTVAVAHQTPTSLPLSAADYHPQFTWTTYPTPDQVLVFGFSPFALVLYDQLAFLCINRKQDRQTWQLVSQVNHNGLGLIDGAMYHQQGQGSVIAHAIGRAEFRRVLVMPVGEDWLYLRFGGQAPIGCRYSVSKPLTTKRVFGSGGWWIGCTPSKQVHFQAQVVGYDFGAVTATAQNLFFDLGPNYKPTQAPVAAVAYRFGGVDGENVVASSDLDGMSVLTETVTNQKITIGLRKDGGTTWESDGTNYKGRIYLLLTAGNPGATNYSYLSPQFLLYCVRFPPLLANRTQSLLTLTDNQFTGWEVETSLRDPRDKRLTIDLTDDGAQRLSATGHDERGGYPVEIWEDANGDGTVDTLRVAAWLHDPTMEILRDVGGSRTQPVIHYRLTAGAILSRGDDERGQWMYLPQIFDPTDGGFVSHTFAIQETLRHIGIDPSDATKVTILTDPQAGTEAAQLPGTWALTSGELHQRHESPWGPQWDESKLQYAQRIARDWRGWLLSEGLNGMVYYWSDRAIEIAEGDTYSSFWTIYRNASEAAAAGAPEQYTLAEPAPTRGIRDPIANVVRVVGKDDKGGFIPHVLARDSDGVPGAISGSNFIGEPRVRELANPLGLDDKSMEQLAKVALARWRRRLRTWTVWVPRAPWQFLPSAINVRDIVTIQGRGDYLITHLRVRELKRSVWWTALTLEKVST